MTRPETKLNRLFEAARTASLPVGSLSPHLKTRVLAHWRSGAQEVASLWLSIFFRRALLCAAVIMTVSVTWCVVTDEPDDEVAVANYELRAELLP